MIIEQWLLIIALGLVCGFLGQALRAIMGIHKATADTEISMGRLFISLIIGALAGALAAIVTVSGDISVNHILALVAAGYAGADFIEGFLGRYLSNKTEK